MTNWAATIAAGLSLTLVVFNAVLVYGNANNQVSVTQRQQLINQGTNLLRIEQAMVRSAASAANPKDDAFNQLLARYNIKVATSTAPEKPATPEKK